MKNVRYPNDDEDGGENEIQNENDPKHLILPQPRILFQNDRETHKCGLDDERSYEDDTVAARQ